MGDEVSLGAAAEGLLDADEVDVFVGELPFNITCLKGVTRRVSHFEGLGGVGAAGLGREMVPTS